MKYILIGLILLINIEAKIIDSKQAFNRSLVKVKQIDIAQKKVFYGNTTYDETKINDISLRYDGFIKNLRADYEGKYIKKGEILFSIYSKEVYVALDALTVSEESYDKNNFTTEMEDNLEHLDIDPSVIKIVQNDRFTPFYIDIKSKHSGVVINKNVNNYSYVKEGSTLFQLADLSTIWVDVFVYQRDLSFVKKDMKAEIYVDGVGVFDAKIDFIEPLLNDETKTIKVRLNLDNKDLKVFPNMFVKATFIKKKETMLILPKSAVITKANLHYVFKPAEDDQFEPLAVEVKRINSKQYQILSGLKKDEIVINNALFMLDSDAVTNGLYNTNQDDDW